jgi:hypothetical protein
MLIAKQPIAVAAGGASDFSGILTESRRPKHKGERTESVTATPLPLLLPHVERRRRTIGKCVYRRNGG